MNMKIKRGDFGYIKAKKRQSLRGTALMALLGGIIFLVGLLLNNMSNRNVFTVIAVLFVLPGAKSLVAFIVAFPYQSVSRERYDRALAVLPDGMTMYTDLIITSAEKVMKLDFAAVGNGQVICLAGTEKQDISYIRSYLTKGIHNWGEGYKVKIVDSEKIFLSELARVELREVDAAEEEQVKSYITSLIV
jgi:hypothetical protein